MLNRHAIVLFLGIAAMALLRGFPSNAVGALGSAFLCLVAGLMFDEGRSGTRANVALVLQGMGVALLVWTAVTDALASGAIPLVAGELGIALTVLGLLGEMRLPYRTLRMAIAFHAVGDVVFLGALISAFVSRNQTPSVTGWIFIVIAAAVSGYAALANLLLQLGRLRDLKAGWRYRVLAFDSDALRMKTLEGEARVPWSAVEQLQRLDDRHLLLVLPSPLPAGLSAAQLPLEELRPNAEPSAADETSPPARYALIFHEQELGAALDSAERVLREHLPRLARPSASSGTSPQSA